MKHHTLTLAMCLAGLTTLSACDVATNDDGNLVVTPLPITVVDGDGETTEIVPTPVVVTTDPGDTETPPVEVTPPPPVVQPPVATGEPGVCTTEGINAWVDVQMRDYYIYYDQVPMVDLAAYEDPDDLVKALRVAPDEYSGIRPLAERNDFFEEGETFGYGFGWSRDQAGALRFQNIVDGSPMDAAGVLRGDRVLGLNGIPETDLTAENVDEIFGDPSLENTVVFSIFH